jgi:8-oxo-dGTP diphosphatase
VSEIVRAAGGGVCRPPADSADAAEPVDESGRVDRRCEIVLVHRPKYDDWTLPKGKLLPGEDDRHAALREVEEETGLRCSIARPIGAIDYRDATGRSKTVRYFLMRPRSGTFTPTHEVDRIVWLPLEQATEQLTYDHDRELLRALNGDESDG